MFQKLEFIKCGASKVSTPNYATPRVSTLAISIALEDRCHRISVKITHPAEYCACQRWTYSVKKCALLRRLQVPGSEGGGNTRLQKIKQSRLAQNTAFFCRARST